MRKWLVLASHDENGTRINKVDPDDADALERVTYVVSGDADLPLDSDIAAALDGYEEGEFLLIPLDAGHKVKTKVTTTVDVAVTQALPR